MTTKIYGQSDDLIEFRGDIEDEIGAYMAQGKGLLLSDGTVLECSYPKTPGLGVWGFKLVRAGRLFDRIEECNDENAEIYSDIVHFKDGLTDFWEIIPEHKQKVLDLLDQHCIEDFAYVSHHEKLMQCMYIEQEY
jgi:hypothetical protein|nr:MAG TPA: hypothetical protein [Caudoviricetes sp.]